MANNFSVTETGHDFLSDLAIKTRQKIDMCSGRIEILLLLIFIISSERMILAKAITKIKVLKSDKDAKGVLIFSYDLSYNLKTYSLLPLRGLVVA